MLLVRMTPSALQDWHFRSMTWATVVGSLQRIVSACSAVRQHSGSSGGSWGQGAPDRVVLTGLLSHATTQPLRPSFCRRSAAAAALSPVAAMRPPAQARLGPLARAMVGHQHSLNRQVGKLVTRSDGALDSLHAFGL